MPRGEDDDDDTIEPDPPLGAVGPVWRRVYQSNAGKHGSEARASASREPRNGQAALDHSVPVKPTSRARVGIDYEDGAIVVLRWHEMGEFHDQLNYEIFHGYVVAWSDLRQEYRNALMRAGMVNLRGKIL